MNARDRLERNVRTRRLAVFRPGRCGAGAALCLLGAAALSAASAQAEGSSGPGLSLAVGASASSDGSAPSPTADTPSQTEVPEDPRVRDPANYEFAFVSVGAYQTWSLAGHFLYFGAGGGLGPPLYRYSKLGDNKAGWDPSLDIVYGNVFLRVKPIPYIDLDLGPKIAITSALDKVKDPPQSGFSYGGYVDLRVGSKNIKVGPRIEYDRIAYYNYYENGWRITPLMLRVVH